MDSRSTSLSFPDYGTPIGKEIKAFLAGKRDFRAEVRHMLFAANRWEKSSLIRESQTENEVVIVNRYTESNLVYGVANGLRLDWLVALEEGLPKSDLVIVLDAPSKGLVSRRPGPKDSYEKDHEPAAPGPNALQGAGAEVRLDDYRWVRERQTRAQLDRRSRERPTRCTTESETMTLRYVAEIRDPVHGYIKITEEERAVIDSPFVQRLRRIHQLAGAYMVYPGGVHSRFEHVLGTMHVAGLIAESIADKVSLDEEQIQELRLAALLARRGSRTVLAPLRGSPCRQDRHQP